MGLLREWNVIGRIGRQTYIAHLSLKGLAANFAGGSTIISNDRLAYLS